MECTYAVSKYDPGWLHPNSVGITGNERHLNSAGITGDERHLSARWKGCLTLLSLLFIRLESAAQNMCLSRAQGCFWIIFLAGLCCLLSGSRAIAIERKSALVTLFTEPLFSTPFAVMPGEASQTLITSASLFTTISHITTLIGGTLITTNILVTGTSLTLVPAPTGNNQLVPSISAIRMLEPGQKSDSPGDNPNPFNDPLEPEVTFAMNSASDATSIRQLYISNQVNIAREEVMELEEMSVLLCSTSCSSGTSLIPETESIGIEQIMPEAESLDRSVEYEDTGTRASAEIFVGIGAIR
ncbi:hypothetical protein C8R43DRAFT_965467 [Mycena crocata]|nr:hypothetical protein C8R43DRAFT_965467 [Mycena crocata]